MYLKFYNLKEEPFSLSPNPDFLYLSEVHKEGLANLRYGLIQKKGFIVITGEVGTGKTTLINALLSEIPQDVKTAFISNPKLERNEFFYLLSKAFKIGNGDNKAKFLINFTEFLEQADKNSENVVLIIDEAHCLTEELLEEIRLLSNLETPNSKLINIILVGQPEFEKILDNPKFRALKQRITLRHKLKPLGRGETSNYVKVRLSRAGAKDAGIFSQKALKAIHEYSGGIPRVINLLADHSMLTGFIKEARTIDDKIIKECARELELSETKNKGRQTESGSAGGSAQTSWNYLFKISIGVMVFMVILFIFWFFGLSMEDRQNLIAGLINTIFSGK